MKSLSVKWGVILVIGLAIFGYTEVWGKSKLQRTTLRGLKGVYVLIEELNPDLEKDGLTGEQLLTDAELKLRKVGIEVLTEEEWLKTPDLPYLYVNINGDKVKNTFYCISIHVSLIQEIRLERNSFIKASGSTWQTSSVGGCNESVVISTVRDGLGDIIDNFINDYLAENPK